MISVNGRTIKRALRRVRGRKALSALVLVAATILVLAAVGAYGGDLVGAMLSRVDPQRVAVREALAAPAMADLRAAYARRHFKPIWIDRGRPRPEGRDLVAMLERSGEDGLDPAAYSAPDHRQQLNELDLASKAERARAELLLSKSYADYVHDLHAPLTGAEMVYTDPALKSGRPTRRAAIEALAAAKTLRQGLAQGLRINPLYVQHRQVLSAYRADPRRDPAVERLMLINLERLRALPVDLGERFVLVDGASGRLTLYEGRRPVDSMKVIVGAPDHPTPIMAGMIRYAVFNPNWNVPPDLTQQTYAPRIQARPSVLSELQMDAWSDHTAQARKLDPISVDWAAVAQGRASVWLRQRPGGQNAMGAVKFMFPNVLGIYLHDTPDRALFDRDPRAFSAGCVRVEDYRRLARWLFGGVNVGPLGPRPEQRFDLPSPVPVYITYLTASAQTGRVDLRPDIYGRDASVGVAAP